MYMNFACECNDITCKKTIRLSVGEMEELKTNMNYILIVEGCLTGPESTDVFVEEKTGYSIFRSEE